MSEPSEALVALVPNVELQAIFYREIAGRLGTGQREEPGLPEFSLAFDRNQENPAQFRLQLRCAIRFPDGAELIAEPVAEYAITDPAQVPITDELMVEYANEVGVMALLPYLRQTIASVSQQVFGTAVLMPIMQRGALSFSIDAAPPDNAD